MLRSQFQSNVTNRHYLPKKERLTNRLILVKKTKRKDTFCPERDSVCDKDCDEWSQGERECRDSWTQE